MANNISNIMNNRFRLSGMASGLDTDSMVKQLMKAEQYKVDKVKQDKQLLEWKRDDYRSINTLLTGFKNDFFDVLKPTSNMRSTNSYKQYSATSSNSAAISATATSNAVTGTHTIEATQLAKAASAMSSGTIASTADVVNFDFSAVNRDFNITLGGVTKNITLNADYTDIAGLKAGIQSAINTAFGAGKITVQNNMNKLEFSTNNGNMSFSSGAADALAQLNIASGASNSGGNVTKTLESLDITGPIIFANKDFNITLNGITKNIKLNGTYNNAAEIRTALATSIDAAFGAGKVTVGNSGDKISFATDNGRVTLTSGTDDALSYIGLTSGASNRLNRNASLDEANTKVALSGNLDFTINGVNFTFDTSTKSMNDVMSEINSSAANVTMTYSEVTDTFTLTSKSNGSGSAITISNNAGNLFGIGSATGIKAESISNGQDAIFNLDGITGIVRSDNNFNVDGVSYNINELNTAVTINVNQNVDGVFDKIKTFVDKYNELISKINGELQEERDKDYLPLTAEQRESMSEDDIKIWETKAKSGSLRGDSILNNVVNSMRKALYESIKDISGGLSSIGITTDSYFATTKAEKGKLIIDETKLKDAIKNSPDKVTNLFAKESTILYSPDLTSSQKSTRYNESGVINRIFDILQDNIRTTRNADGKKGLLLEKAGAVGDLTEYNSLIPDQIGKKEQIISDLLDRLYDKESGYYKKFAALEKAMSQMNNQSSWLSQQFGGGQ